jgi:hypothetical protein
MRSIAATIVLWFAIAGPAIACSCVMPDGSRSEHVRRGYQQAQSVFSAYVAEVYYSSGTPARRMAKLRVLQVWKGELQPDTWLEVESDPDTGLSCGLAVEPETAILAYTSGHVLVSCSMTGPLHQATQDIPVLNRLARREK